MANKVAWFEIVGNDGPKLREFYGRLFDWQFHDAEGMDYGMIDGKDGGIGGGIGKGPHPGLSYVTVYVQVASIDATLARAEKLGAKTLLPRTVIPQQVTFAMFSDPEGHMVGLLEDAQ